ncbi:MAG: S1C family serine protease, partial [Heliobacteriaceae bacterium]|nr:S1C family serine protease [Heliobacteriaceae bacterium]
MLKRIMLLIFICICLPAAALEPDEALNISLYERINPAIVAIDAQIPDGFSAGTGCVIKSNGLILTGSHVVDGAKNIEVKTHNGQVYKAEVFAQMGKSKDLAILKIKPKDELQTIAFGDSGNVKVGQRVLAIGNPFGFSGTLTQ